jgi:isopentenyl-diphosphate delta-isomerase
MPLAIENISTDPSLNDHVILIDQHDQQTGLMPKLEAHQKGLLHRAFSVFIFNSKGEMLLQQRAFGKYHSEGLWSNTCCSHPLPDEKTAHAASRRLLEEMGMEVPIQFLYSFLYKSELDKGLTEHELDHVFWGISDQSPELNPREVANYRYMKPQELAADLKANPGNYTEWLKICFEDVMNRITRVSQTAT